MTGGKGKADDYRKESQLSSDGIQVSMQATSCHSSSFMFAHTWPPSTTSLTRRAKHTPSPTPLSK